MARGWESKSVEAQQADRESQTPALPPISAGEAARLARRRTLEMARARAVQDLAAARAPAHRSMLEAAIAAIEAQIAALGTAVTALLVAAGLVSAFVVASCGGPSASVGSAAPPVAGTPGAAPAAAAPSTGAASGAIKIVFLGDSVTAGLGLLTDEAYPAVIGRQFAADGYPEVEIVNAGVSGDTTAGGLRRLDDVLEPGARILVVALGGNDALRGLSPAQTHDNLAAIIQGAQAKDVQVVLVGMLAPPNLGPDYRDAFAKAFADLARDDKKTVAYVPFLLEGVAGNPALNQPDGIHPTAEGARIIANHLYPTLHNLVDAMQ
jgi:acyl-CoA thioesterase I